VVLPAETGDECAIVLVIAIVGKENNLRLVLDDGLHSAVEPFRNAAGEVDLAQSGFDDSSGSVRHSKRTAIVALFIVYMK
jgi:hypothetical protein